jgi:hypothetical protein
MDTEKVMLALSELQRYREQLARTSDPQLQTQLQALITEAEKKLAQMRLAAYRPLMRPQ